MLFSISGLSFAEGGTKLRIGLLPVADAILLIAADEKGFFKKRGIEVELVMFQSAGEKDVVAMAGSLDGEFCEIISIIVQRASEKDFVVVATTSHTNPMRRMFGLVTSPKYSDLSIADLKDKELLNSKRSITDFLTDRFFEKMGLPGDYMKRRDVRKIPVRMQLLLSGQGYASLIPEPMLTLAESAGGKVLADDRDLDMPLASVALRGDLPSETIKAFQAALAEAVSFVNANPSETLRLMEKKNLIPPDIREEFKLPLFDPKVLPYKLPDRKLFDSYVEYLQGIEVLQGKQNPEGLPVPAYEEIIWNPDSKSFK
jgi:NitT/TauT family transport system substrate-binding protein